MLHYLRFAVTNNGDDFQTVDQDVFFMPICIRRQAQGSKPMSCALELQNGNVWICDLSKIINSDFLNFRLFSQYVVPGDLKVKTNEKEINIHHTTEAPS